MNDGRNDREFEEMESLLRAQRLKRPPGEITDNFADSVMEQIRLPEPKEGTRTVARWFAFGRISLPAGALVAACLVLVFRLVFLPPKAEMASKADPAPYSQETRLNVTEV